MAWADTAMMGIFLVSGAAFKRRVASQPSMPGRPRSMRIRSGRSVTAMAMPCSASVATSTVKPARPRRFFMTYTLSSLSSMYRILMASLGGSAPLDGGHERMAELAQQLVGIGPSLEDHALDTAVEAGAIVLGEVLGGYDEHRNVAAVRAAAELGQELEAVHLGHHQIEHDDVRRGRGETLEPDAPILGLLDRPAVLAQYLVDDCPRGLVVLDQQHASGLLAADRPKQLEQAVAIDGLHHILGRAEREAAVFLVEDGHDDDGDVGQGRIPLQGREDCPAVEVRHHDVERHGGGAELTRAGQRFDATGGRDDGESLFDQESLHQPSYGGVVIDDEHEGQ